MPFILALVGAASWWLPPCGGAPPRRLRVVWLRVRGRRAAPRPTSRCWPGRSSARTCTPRSSTPRSPWPAGRSPWQKTSWAASCSSCCSCRSTLSIFYGKDFVRESRIAEDRSTLERKAEEVLSQEELAPKRWADRLAPEVLPEFDGFELGRRYQAGTGLMAGDFYDVIKVGAARVAAVIGDVTGQRHRRLDHRVPGQVPAAGVPAAVPRPGPGASRSSTSRCRRCAAPTRS